MVIGIIEDDNLLRKALDTSLKNQGYTTESFYSTGIVDETGNCPGG